MRILLLLLLAACSGHLRVAVDARPTAQRPARLAVAPAVLLHEVPDVVETDPFRDNLYVGNLVFRGGYVTEQQDVGLQNVSAHVDREAVDAYEQQVRDITDQILGDALQRVAWTRTEPLPASALTAPRKLRERGTYPDAGKDNVNLPRIRLEPRSLSGDALAAVPSGHDALLVPYVVQYYSHNAGWFVGQTWGSAAGARYRLLLVSYDASSGAPLGWTDVDARFLHDRIFQPNSSQIEDFLMAVERRVAREVRQNLPR